MLDPNLHKYIPWIEAISRELAEIREKKIDENLMRFKEDTLKKVRAVSEVNPMLGHRGVRLGISYPEIYDMQIQAILEASAELLKEGVDVRPEIMVPQVGVVEELAWVKDRVKTIYEDVRQRYQIEIPYKFGTMIEVVRACMRANKLAEISEFFSFGTNDLTQATFSFSREDAEREFLPLYDKYQILQDNPFETLDEEGVGRLMMISVDFARQVKPDLKIGICGEHGGDPKAIYFCHKIGLSYVSASPHRVPIARLAAAHAVLAARSADKSL